VKMCGKGMVIWENDGEMCEGKISWGYMGENERRGKGNKGIGKNLLKIKENLVDMGNI
jgi:hypothetical protein